MTKNKYVYGHFDHGQDFIRLAKPPIAKVTRGSGSHVKVTILQGEYAGKSTVVPDHKLGVGLSHKLWRFFVKAGLITLAVGLVYMATMSL